MGNKISTTSTISFNLYNFEKVQNAIKNNDIIINTLSENQQECLIAGTTNIKDEVTILNQYLKNKKDALIIIYGKNSNDNTVLTKYDQLIGLGFNNVAIYLGGIFEWLLLQDIYGYDNFPTTSKEIDILKYR
jgi:nitrogenase molybdenum-iron protein alpha/beta subunit